MKTILVKHIVDAVNLYYSEGGYSYKLFPKNIIKELENHINGMDEIDFVKAVDILEIFARHDLNKDNSCFKVFSDILLKSIFDSYYSSDFNDEGDEDDEFVFINPTPNSDSVLSAYDYFKNIYDQNRAIQDKDIEGLVNHRITQANAIEKSSMSSTISKTNTMERDVLHGIFYYKYLCDLKKIKFLLNFCSDNKSDPNAWKHAGILLSNLDILPDSIFSKESLMASSGVFGLVFYESFVDEIKRSLQHLGGIFECYDFDNFIIDAENRIDFLKRSLENNSNMITSSDDNKEVLRALEIAHSDIDLTNLHNKDKSQHSVFYNLLKESYQIPFEDLNKILGLVDYSSDESRGKNQWKDLFLSNLNTKNSFERELLFSILKIKRGISSGEDITREENKELNLSVLPDTKEQKYMYAAFLSAFRCSENNNQTTQSIDDAMGDWSSEKGAKPVVIPTNLAACDSFTFTGDIKLACDYGVKSLGLKLKGLTLRPTKKTSLHEGLFYGYNTKSRMSDVNLIPVFTRSSDPSFMIGLYPCTGGARYFHVVDYGAKYHNKKTGYSFSQTHLGLTATNRSNLIKILDWNGGFKAGPRQKYGEGQYFSYIGKSEEVLSARIKSNSPQVQDLLFNPPSNQPDVTRPNRYKRSPNGYYTTSAYGLPRHKSDDPSVDILAKVKHSHEKPVANLSARRNHQVFLNYDRLHAARLRNIDSNQTTYLITDAPPINGGSGYREANPRPEVIAFQVYSDPR
jgi:hypothetical protein